MKDVSAISLLPVQALDPVTEGSMEELQDSLVPVQEEDLPQGVLVLVVSLILRQRPAMETSRAVAWQSMAASHGVADVERDGARPVAPVVMSYPHVGPLFNKPKHAPLPQPTAPAAPSIDRVIVPTHSNPQPSIRVAPVLISRSSNTIEPFPVGRTVIFGAPLAPAIDAPLPVDAISGRPLATPIDTPLPEALMSHQAARHAPPVARPSIPSPATPQPLPALDVQIETLPGTDRSLLQVPFNRGAASGQVTISRVPDEPTRSLQLSPSNALVFEQLKVPFELVREPAWRLTDSGGEQQRQGSHQAPDDEQAEDSGLPA
ncbi:MAG: hypothetical protein ACRES5_30070 [Pseudomonas sp.]